MEKHVQQTLFLNKNIERQYRRNTMKKILLFSLLAFCFMGTQMVSFSSKAISFKSVDENAGISLKEKFGDTQKKK